MLGPEFPALNAENRQRFIDSLGEDAALFFSPPHYLRNGDAEYPYRQSSDILWLTGWTDPDFAVLIRPKSDHPVVMFVQPKDPAKEVWTGRRPGVEGAKELFGADQAFEIEHLSKQLPNLLQGVNRLHYRFADSAENDRLLLRSIAVARRKAKQNGLSIPEEFVDPSKLLHSLRLIKSPAEIELLKRAADITCNGHQAAMAMTRPGVFEYQLEAKIAHVFRDSGGTGPGYTTIVGGGENAVILHYIENDSPLNSGDLVCVDAGCEYSGYTADVTRTWPVDGRFSKPQKELYNAVLDAQLAAIDAAVVGNTFIDVHNVTVRKLTEGLVRLGFLEGNVDELIANNSFRRWYMHGTSHWLGMDVHDVGSYGSAGESQDLQPGMLLTIEPGLYIAGDDEQAPERFRGIGIRIEDDILVTSNGPFNLTSRVPKSVEGIEAIVGTG